MRHSSAYAQSMNARGIRKWGSPRDSDCTEYRVLNEIVIHKARQRLKGSRCRISNLWVKRQVATRTGWQPPANGTSGDKAKAPKLLGKVSSTKWLSLVHYFLSESCESGHYASIYHTLSVKPALISLPDSRIHYLTIDTALDFTIADSLRQTS